MNFVWDKIAEWLKGLLVSGIVSNHSGLFDSINTRVSDVASTVGTTPQEWNSGIFNMIRSLSENVDAIFSGQNHVIMFPGRLCSRKQDDGSIRDLPWGKACVQKSVKHQHDVVPIHFIGHNSPRFYSVARWCKRLHLPNFAMALLPDEMYRSRGGSYTVRIGLGRLEPLGTPRTHRTPSPPGKACKTTIA